MSSWQAKRRFSGPTLRVTIGEPEGLDIVNTSSVANWGGGWLPAILWTTGFLSSFWAPGFSCFADGISGSGAGLAGAIFGGVFWG